jgi:hypothetical protein
VPELLALGNMSIHSKIIKYRRLLWNIYAWPITLLLAYVVVEGLPKDDLLSGLDTVVSIPSLVALHLYIWDKNAFSQKFWKPYSFVFLAWELIYNLFIQPMDSGKPFQPAFLIVPVIFLPLYVALFKYAFRRWQVRVA